MRPKANMMRLEILFDTLNLTRVHDITDRLLDSIDEDDLSWVGWLSPVCLDENGDIHDAVLDLGSSSN